MSSSAFLLPRFFCTYSSYFFTVSSGHLQRVFYVSCNVLFTFLPRVLSYVSFHVPSTCLLRFFPCFLFVACTFLVRFLNISSTLPLRFLYVCFLFPTFLLPFLCKKILHVFYSVFHAPSTFLVRFFHVSSAFVCASLTCLPMFFYVSSSFLSRFFHVFFTINFLHVSTTSFVRLLHVSCTFLVFFLVSCASSTCLLHVFLKLSNFLMFFVFLHNFPL